MGVDESAEPPVQRGHSTELTLVRVESSWHEQPPNTRGWPATVTCFIQLDVDCCPCFACFTSFIRRTDRPAEPLRVRDLPVGAGDRVDVAREFCARAICRVSDLAITLVCSLSDSDEGACGYRCSSRTRAHVLRARPV